MHVTTARLSFRLYAVPAKVQLVSHDWFHSVLTVSSTVINVTVDSLVNMCRQTAL